MNPRGGGVIQPLEGIYKKLCVGVNEDASLVVPDNNFSIRINKFAIIFLILSYFS
jgi:hypothetical protein